MTLLGAIATRPLRRSPAGAFVLPLLSSLLLAACVSPAPQQESVAAPSTGLALLAIEVANQHRSGLAPGMLELAIEDAAARQRRVALPARPATAGQQASSEFLFVLDLPAGPHRIREISGRIWADEQEGLLRLAVDVPIDVEAGAVRYLGRLRLSNVARIDRRDQPSGPAQPAGPQHRFGLADGTIQFASAFSVDDDLSRFRAAYPQMPLRWVQPLALTVVAVERAPLARLPPLLLSFAEMDAALSEASPSPPVRRVSDLPVPPRARAEARRAWREFAAAELPRAFALAGDGSAWGWAAAREDAWLAALDQCARRGKGCRIYALDDRVTAPD